MSERSAKPARLLDRNREWELLSDFLDDPSPELRLAIVSGRRRNGKSFLLEALTESVGGLYLSAVQEEGRVPASAGSPRRSPRTPACRRGPCGWRTGVRRSPRPSRS